MRKLSYNELSAIQKKMIDEAEKVMDTAYNPYSNFFVGAALLTDDETIITGSNVENASYSATICAERSALVRANAMSYKNFKSIAIISKGEAALPNEIVSPCGCCRQMIYEASIVSKNDIEVIMSDTNKQKVIISSISELLPLAFGSI